MGTHETAQIDAVHLRGEIDDLLRANPGYRIWERLPPELARRIGAAEPGEVLELAFALWETGKHRHLWAANTALRLHPTALELVRWRELERMGQTMDHWGSVDAFAALAGPAWRQGRISDARIHRWARSRNRWFRRAALVCTVFLNRRSVGGTGDPKRTLEVCRLLVNDRDDMVVKAMSWALRELVGPHSDDVRGFLAEHQGSLAARVRREVRNKLTTGLKNPWRGARRNGAAGSAS